MVDDTLRQNDPFFSRFRDPASYSSVLFLVTQRSSSFGGRRKHRRSFLRSSLPHPLRGDNERVCRRTLFRPLWIFVQVFMDLWDRWFAKPNRSFMIHILISFESSH